MKQFLVNTQTKISEIIGVLHIDEDWGQLDNYTPNAPIQWPCCLIDVSNLDFSDNGRDKDAIPQNRQEASGSITLTFANLKSANSGIENPQAPNNSSWLLQNLIEEVHAKVHGFMPVTSAGKLIRKSLKRIKRNDGIQQYDVVYSIGMHNI
jgi:hypothetical protein